MAIAEEVCDALSDHRPDAVDGFNLTRICVSNCFQTTEPSRIEFSSAWAKMFNQANQNIGSGRSRASLIAVMRLLTRVSLDASATKTSSS